MSSDTEKIMVPLRTSFFLTLIFFSSLFFISTLTEARQLDIQIEQLEEMKRGYEAKALRHEDYAERLQFDNRSFLEARRHIELAEENRAQAAKIQQKIDQLKAKRAKLATE